MKEVILGFLGKPSIRFHAKQALSEADAPFARMKLEGFRMDTSVRQLAWIWQRCFSMFSPKNRDGIWREGGGWWGGVKIGPTAYELREWIPFTSTFWSFSENAVLDFDARNKAPP